MSIASRWQVICDEIEISQKNAASCTQLPTNLADSSTTTSATTPRIVSTIAVSKRQVVDSIRQAYQAGARNFGESFIQEAIPKIHMLADLKLIKWHFIGPIQSNKSRQIAESFDWVHSLSREKIALRLSQHRPLKTAPLNVLIQVNISSEESKSGVSAEQMLPLAKKIIELPRLKLRGLMCIPEKSLKPQLQAENFQRMVKLLQTLQQFFLNNSELTIDTLSMGMSNDYQDAILAGSNMVRVGTALFGRRD